MDKTYNIPNEFTILEVEGFKEDVYAWIAEQPIHLIIDFSACTFIDSTGLGAIVSVFKRLNQHNGTLLLRNMQPYVRELFKMTRLDKVMEIK